MSYQTAIQEIFETLLPEYRVKYVKGYDDIDSVLKKTQKKDAIVIWEGLQFNKIFESNKKSLPMLTFAVLLLGNIDDVIAKVLAIGSRNSASLPVQGVYFHELAAAAFEVHNNIDGLSFKVRLGLA